MENSICLFFCFMAEAMILEQYASHLFYGKTSKNVRYCVLCLLYLGLFALSFLESGYLNAILYLLANMIFLLTQYRLNWWLSLFHSALLTVIMGICELLVYEIFKYLSPDFLIENKDFYHLVIFAVLNKLVFFTIIYTLLHVFKGRQEGSLIQDKSVFLLLFIPLTSVFVTVTFIFVSQIPSTPAVLNWMVILSEIFLIATNLLVFGTHHYNVEKNMRFTEMQLLLQKESASREYYEMLRLQNENQRIFIHDMKNHLHSIELLNEQQDHNKVSAYIRQLMQSSDLKESSRLCDHDLLNSILCRYKHQCNNSHISFHTDIRSGTMNFMTDNDITSLFCNLLDNAMEAAEGIPDSYIEVTASKKEKVPFVVIIVINSCRKNPFAKSGGQLTTNKTDTLAHGFGLKSIQKTIEKYSGNMQMYYNEHTLTFHTIIRIKKKL